MAEVSIDPDVKVSLLAKDALERELVQLKIDAERRAAERLLAEPQMNGQFHFIGPVHEASVHNTMATIEAYLRRSPAGTPVEIVLNSGGGSVIDGMAFIDFLKGISAAGHQTTIIGTGMVASMASAILSAADVRVLTPRCSLGIHEVANTSQGSLTVQEDNLKFMRGLQDLVVELMCERSTLTPAKVRALWKRRDVYLSPAECLKLGLIDRIQGEGDKA